MSMSPIDPLIETWHTNERMNQLLLGAISSDALDVSPAPRARSVGAQFAHMHNVRLMWIEAGAPRLLETLSKLNASTPGTPESIGAALLASAEAIAELVRSTLDSGRTIPGFKAHPTAFVGYLIAHDAHHRGAILLALKLAGKRVDRAVSHALWEWA